MSNTVITNYTDLNGPSTKAESSVVVIVNKDGSLSVDQNLLGTLMGTDGSQGAGISVVRVGHEGKPDDATDSDSDDGKIPHVTMSVDSYYNEPNSIIKYDSGAEMLQSLRIETRENSLLGFQNDHCYTLLTSPSQTLPQTNETYKAYEEPKIEITHDPPPKPVPNSKKITILEQQIIPKGKKIILNPAEPSIVFKGSDVLSKPLPVISKQKAISAVKKAEKSDDNTESSSISSSGDSIPDRDSDSDYKDVKDRSAPGKTKRTKPRILKAVASPKISKIDPKVSSRLKSNRSLIKKEIKEKIQQKAIDKKQNDLNMSKEIVAAVESENVPAHDPIKVVSKQTPKPSKKEKKTPSHVTALLSDMTSLFSTPDVIRRVSTDAKLPTKPEKEQLIKTRVDSIENKLESLTESGDRLKTIAPKTYSKVKTSDQPEKVSKNFDLMPQLDDASLAQILQDSTSTIPKSQPSITSATINSPSWACPLSPSLDLLGGLQPEEEGLTVDMLLHVAQLVESSENLQEVIDKQVLGKVDPIANKQSTPLTEQTQDMQTGGLYTPPKSVKNTIARKDPIEIVRKDGRVITLPPIEAPATRSSKRKIQVEPVVAEVVPVVAPPTYADIITPDTQAQIQHESKQFPNRKVILKKIEPSSPVQPPSTEKFFTESQDSWNSEDDPYRLWCICRQPHNNRFMICCDSCEDWFHGKCVNITKAMGQQMEEQGIEWRCPNCVKKTKAGTIKTPNKPLTQKKIESDPVSPTQASSSVSVQDSKTTCIVCKKPARPSSIYCSDACILKHAQDSLSSQTASTKVDSDTGKPQDKSRMESRVIVYERKSGRLLAGPNAPTAENLKTWLQKNPTFEVVRPGTLSAIKPMMGNKRKGPPGHNESSKIQTTLNFERIPKKPAAEPATPKTESKVAPSKTPESKVAPSKIPESKVAPSKTSESKVAPSKTSESKVAPAKTPDSKPAPSKLPGSELKQQKLINVKVVPSLKEEVKTPPPKTPQPKTPVVTRSQQLQLQETPKQSMSRLDTPRTSRSQDGPRMNMIKLIDTPKPGPSRQPDTPKPSTSKAAIEPKKPTRLMSRSQSTYEKNATVSPSTSRKKDTPDSNRRMDSTEPIRENVRKALQEQMTLRRAESKKTKLTESEIQQFALDTELELYELFSKDVGMKYKAKYRSLMFNIKDRKNLSLWQKICDGEISPKQLVRLSPEELASQELAQWRDKEAKYQLELIKKSELDLLAASKTYVLKTHKGEEVMETKESVSTELDPNLAVEDLVTALNDSSGVQMDSTVDTSQEIIETPSKPDKKHSKGKDSSKKSSRESKRDADSRKSRSRRSDTREQRSTRRSEKNKRDQSISKDRSKSSSKDKESDRARTRRRSRSRVKSRKRSKSRDRSSSDSQGRERSKSRSRSLRRPSQRDGRRKERSRSKRRSSDDKKTRSKSQEVSKKSKNDSTDSEPLERPKSAMLKEVHPEYDPHEPMITSALSEEDLRKDSFEESFKAEVSFNEAYFDAKAFSIDPILVSPKQSGKQDKLSEAESDQEPSSTVESSAATVWNGCINMVDVARFYVATHEVSGTASDLEEDLAAELDIVGRINPETVWDYIGKMKRTSNKDIVILRLQAANDEEQMQYIALYSYLSSRNRLGVVKVSNTATVKDFYIVPLPLNTPVPPVLLPFDGPGLGEVKTHLLIAIIIRQRRKRLAANLPKEVIPAKVVRESRKRSYTPPPVKGFTPPSSPRRKQSLTTYTSPALSTSVKDKIAASLASAADDDEPYSPGSSTSSGSAPNTLRTKMDELNRQIEEQKLQIMQMARADSSVAEDEAYSPSRPMTPPSATPLSAIALPANLQEILATIKQRENTNDVDMRPQPAE